jgi:hypothetical protein
MIGGGVSRQDHALVVFRCPIGLLQKRPRLAIDLLGEIFIDLALLR